MVIYSLWLPSQETRFECQKCGERWGLGQPAGLLATHAAQRVLAYGFLFFVIAISGDPVRVSEARWGVGQPARLLATHAAQRVLAYGFLFFVISIIGDPVRVSEVRGGLGQPASLLATHATQRVLAYGFLFFVISMSGDPVRMPEVRWGLGQPAGLLATHAAQRVLAYGFLFFVISISGDPVRVPEVRWGLGQPAGLLATHATQRVLHARGALRLRVMRQRYGIGRLSVLWSQDRFRRMSRQVVLRGLFREILNACLVSQFTWIFSRNISVWGSGSLRIRTNFGRLDPDPDPGGQNDPQKYKKVLCFWSAGCSLLMAEGFFVAWTFFFRLV